MWLVEIVVTMLSAWHLFMQFEIDNLMNSITKVSYSFNEMLNVSNKHAQVYHAVEGASTSNDTA